MPWFRSLILLTAAVSVFSLCACVTSSTQYLERDSQLARIKEERERQMDAEPAVVDLMKKFKAKGQSTSLSQFANPELLAGSERVALATYYSMMSEYQEKYTNIIRQFNPEIADIFELNKAAFTTLVIDLYTQKISFGQYNKTVFESQIKMDEAIRLRDLEIVTNRTNQVAAVGVAMTNYAQYLQTQQLINAQNRPIRVVPFTCVRSGNSTTCR